MTALLVSLALAGLVSVVLRLRNGRFRAVDAPSAAGALPAPGRLATFVQVSTEACATCPRVAATLEEVAAGVPGVRFAEVPAESRPDLLETYDIRRSPTVFLLDAGEAGEALDGFDHTQYKDEVEQRWGKEAYAASDAWWRGMSEAERHEWKVRQETLAADWAAAAAEGVDPTSDRAQELAARHVAWLGSIPGTPGYGDRPVAAYVTGLGEMYVADPRFAKNYGGTAGATFVRDALATYAAAHL